MGQRAVSPPRPCACARRRALLAAVAATALLWPTWGMAVRVNDVPRFATLDRSTIGRLPQGPCTVPAGSSVEMVAEISGLGTPATAQRQWFVRVVDGVCQGAEASVSQDNLRDERDTPAPPAPPERPPR